MALRSAFEPLFGATVDAQALPSTENNSSLRRSANSAGPAVALNDSSRPARPAALEARLDQLGHSLFGARRTRLRPSRRGDSHPALDAALKRGHSLPGTVTDALHAAADEDMPGARSHQKPSNLR